MVPGKPIKIIVSCPDAFAAYRRRALGTNIEVFGVLTGRASRSASAVTIEDIVYPPVVADYFGVQYSLDIFNTIPRAIGTVHSHLDIQPALSHQDMRAQATEGDLVFAVFSIWKPKGAARRSTELNFYVGSPLPRVYYPV